jgi:hypothetical protein
MITASAAVLDAETSAETLADAENHNAKMLSCGTSSLARCSFTLLFSGVFHLSLALWPVPELTQKEKKLALEELKWLIEKQYRYYIKYALQSFFFLFDYAVAD